MSYNIESKPSPLNKKLAKYPKPSPLNKKVDKIYGVIALTANRAYEPVSPSSTKCY